HPRRSLASQSRGLRQDRGGALRPDRAGSAGVRSGPRRAGTRTATGHRADRGGIAGGALRREVRAGRPVLHAPQAGSPPALQHLPLPAHDRRRDHRSADGAVLLLADGGGTLAGAVSPPFVPEWSIHPSVLAGSAALALLYWYLLGPYRKRVAAPATPSWRILCFAGALLVLLGSLNGPIHDLSDTYLFWVHMGQHLLLTMVYPPLFIAGLPGWFVDRLTARPPVRRTARFLTHPVFAGIFF